MHKEHKQKIHDKAPHKNIHRINKNQLEGGEGKNQRARTVKRKNSKVEPAEQKTSGKPAEMMTKWSWRRRSRRIQGNQRTRAEQVTRGTQESQQSGRPLAADMESSETDFTVQVGNIGNFETAFGSDRPDRDSLTGSLGDDTDARSVLEMTGGVSVHGPDILDGGRHYQKHQR